MWLLVVVSRSTGQSYWVELATGESTYDRPTGGHGDGDGNGDDVGGLMTKNELEEINLHEVMDDADEVAGVGGSLLSEDATLPVGWETRTNRTTGDRFYLNVSTAETTYDRPTMDAGLIGTGRGTATATGRGRDTDDPDGDENFESDSESSRESDAENEEETARARAADRGAGGFARGVGPLRTVEELLARHQAAVVVQAHWRGKLGRRLLDQVFAAALFRRFADRDETDESGRIVGVAVRHRKCGELLRLCGLSEVERGVGRERMRGAVAADEFWRFSGLVRTQPMGFESFMAALAHFSAK